jgi:hypothetical protein
VRFYRQVAEVYSGAERIYIVIDNWPVHWHPDVVVALERQETPYRGKLPRTWPLEASQAARAEWGGVALPIQLVQLAEKGMPV